MLIPISTCLQKPLVAVGGERIPCLGLEHEQRHPKRSYALLNPLISIGLEGCNFAQDCGYLKIFNALYNIF